MKCLRIIRNLWNTHLNHKGKYISKSDHQQRSFIRELSKWEFEVTNQNNMELMEGNEVKPGTNENLSAGTSEEDNFQAEPGRSKRSPRPWHTSPGKARRSQQLENEPKSWWTQMMDHAMTKEEELRNVYMSRWSQQKGIWDNREWKKKNSWQGWQGILKYNKTEWSKHASQIQYKQRRDIYKEILVMTKGVWGKRVYNNYLCQSGEQMSLNIQLKTWDNIWNWSKGNVDQA